MRIPPFALIVNNGPPWKIIVEGTVAQLGGLSNEIASPHLGTHLAAFFNQHKIYQIKFECSGVVQMKCKAAETSTKITCQSHCNQSEFPSPPPCLPLPPTDAILMMALRDVCAQENLHVKSFSIGCMGPCKTGYKMARKKMQNEERM